MSAQQMLWIVQYPEEDEHENPQTREFVKSIMILAARSICTVCHRHDGERKIAVAVSVGKENIERGRCTLAGLCVECAEGLDKKRIIQKMIDHGFGKE